MLVHDWLSWSPNLMPSWFIFLLSFFQLRLAQRTQNTTTKRSPYCIARIQDFILHQSQHPRVGTSWFKHTDGRRASSKSMSRVSKPSSTDHQYPRRHRARKHRVRYLLKPQEWTIQNRPKKNDRQDGI